MSTFLALVVFSPTKSPDIIDHMRLFKRQAFGVAMKRLMGTYSIETQTGIEVPVGVLKNSLKTGGVCYIQSQSR